jgi:uncharacterized protein YdhG (YjbR/CyaY superfamily)
MSPTKEKVNSSKTKGLAESTTEKGKTSNVWSDEEKAAMRDLARERKQEANKAEGEKAALEAIAALQEPDRSMAKRIHAIVKASAPTLSPKTWYGMPAYANQEGKVVCFFQSASKFKTRYATFGFSDSAHLDQGALWPIAFALTELNATAEAKIAALLKKAVS